MKGKYIKLKKVILIKKKIKIIIYNERNKIKY